MHCHNRLALGGDCSADPASCQSFTACDPSTRKCVAASHVGQLCGNLLGYPFLCGGGVCAQDTNNVSHCVMPVDDGGACAQAYECSSGACTNGVCTPQVSNDGTACKTPGDCTSGICDSAGTGLCVAKSGDGADCTDDLSCMSGWCSGAKCTAPVANGMACTDGTNCTSGHCAAGTCAACP
jgi:hypothetical protein